MADRAFVEFEVAYQPGTLLAKIFDESGTCIGTDCLKTPGETENIVLAPEVDDKKQGSLIYVPIRVEVSGAELVALGSEALKSEEDFHGETTCLYQGEAMAILRVSEDDSLITLKVSCEQCRTVEMTL